MPRSHEMYVLDLFSGIGGFSLGLERAGMKTVAFCEQDRKCQLVLKRHWPEIPIYDDIRTLTAERLRQDGIGPIELVCGGFPCQPFSTAGKRRGDQDDRHLWPEMFRLIQEIRPNWVIGENVAGIINMGLDQVLSDLEGAHYTCQPFIIPACAVNAPHRRDRVWIIANDEIEQDRRIFERRMEANIGTGGENVADTQGERCGKTRADCNRSEERLAGSGEILADAEIIRFQGMRTDREQVVQPYEGQGVFGGRGKNGEWWAVEPNVGRVAPRFSGRVDRLKQLGNAVVPQIVEMIGRTIMEIKGQHVPIP